MPTPSAEEQAIIMRLALEKAKFEKDVAETAAKVKAYAAQMKTDFKTVGEGLKLTPSNQTPDKVIDKAVQSLEKIPPATNNASKGFFNLNKIMNTTLGILTAMVITTITSAIGKFFGDAIEGAKKLRAEVVALNFSESILSKKGMDISRKDLDDFVKYIEGRYQYLSKVQATAIVSETSVAVQEFDITKEQLIGLADSIAFIQTKQKLMGQTEADAAHIINAAMDARSNFFNGMGINISETIVKEKAYAMGLAERGAELDKATRFQAIAALLTEQTSDKQEELNKQLENSPLGRQMEVTKKWADTTAEVGLSVLALQDSWNNFLLSSENENPFEGMKTSLEAIITSVQLLIELGGNLRDAYTPVRDLYLEMWGTSKKEIDERNKVQMEMTKLQTLFISGNKNGNWQDFVIDTKLATGAKLTREEYERLKEVLLTFPVDKINEMFPDPSKIKDRFVRELVVSVSEKQDTPKDERDDGYVNPAILENEKELADALKKMEEEILSSQQKYAQDLINAEIDLMRKMEDIDIEYAKKRAEALIDYDEKVADINRDYSDKIADIDQKEAERKEKARKDARDKEAEFQNKMKEMREDFLMSLEDALHSRDARQILKLIRNYELEKMQAQRKHDLDMKSDAEDERIASKKAKREREQAERDQKRKLEKAKIDYQRKMAQLKREEDAERAAARLADKRKRDDLLRGMKDRLAIMAADLVAQYNLTKKGLDAILDLFKKYYSDGGYLSQVMAGMNNRLPKTPGSTPGKTTPPSNPQNDSRRGRGTGRSPLGFSETPSSPFGEGEIPRLPNIPTGNLATAGANFGQSSMGGFGGNVSIELLLSPDLEGRIVTNSLNQTANIIMRTQRSK